MRNLLSVLVALFVGFSAVAEIEDQPFDAKGAVKPSEVNQAIVVTDSKAGLLYVYAADSVDKAIFDKKNDDLTDEEKGKVFKRADVQLAIKGKPMFEHPMRGKGDTSEITSTPTGWRHRGWCRWNNWGYNNWGYNYNWYGGWGGCNAVSYVFPVAVSVGYVVAPVVYNYGWAGYGGGYYGNFSGCGYYGNFF